MRASNYYRTAEFYQRDHPADDPEVTLLSARVRDTFADPAGLLDPPKHWPSRSRGPRRPATCSGRPGRSPRAPTLINHGGYDSALEEAYFAAGAAARRGYTCIAFHGPGQGAVLRDQGLTIRPDRETIAGAVIDAALQRPDIDPQRVALMGTSPGGFLAARAAAFEHRPAALIVHDATFDTRSGLLSPPPPQGIEEINGNPQRPIRQPRHRDPGSSSSHQRQNSWPPSPAARPPASDTAARAAHRRLSYGIRCRTSGPGR